MQTWTCSVCLGISFLACSIIKEVLFKCTWSFELPYICWPSNNQAEKLLELMSSKRWISIRVCIPQHVKQLATNTVDLVSWNVNTSESRKIGESQLIRPYSIFPLLRGPGFVLLTPCYVCLCVGLGYQQFPNGSLVINLSFVKLTTCCCSLIVSTKCWFNPLLLHVAFSLFNNYSVKYLLHFVTKLHL